MKEQDFERCFVETVFQLAESMYPNQLAFGKKVWPEKPDGSIATTLHSIRKKNSRGKTQMLRLWEALRMAEAVNRPFPSLCFEVTEKIKLGWAEKPYKEAR